MLKNDKVKFIIEKLDELYARPATTYRFEARCVGGMQEVKERGVRTPGTPSRRSVSIAEAPALASMEDEFGSPSMTDEERIEEAEREQAGMSPVPGFLREGMSPVVEEMMGGAGPSTTPPGTPRPTPPTRTKTKTRNSL